MQSRASTSRRAMVAGLAACCIAPPAHAQAGDGVPDFLELPVEDMERLGQTVWIKPIADGVWITCATFDAGRLGDVPANGLIIAGDPGPTIVDTGNNREQGDLILAAAQRVAGRPAAQAIATHFHADRTGGIEAMRVAGVPAYAHPYSVGLAQAYDFPAPSPVRGLEKEPVTLGPVELFYPGAGHTRDNITVWHAASRTLFGGCLLRATTDRQIGNLSDADIDAYPSTIDRVIARYPERRLVIPGHGAIAGDALEWTRRMLAERAAH